MKKIITLIVFCFLIFADRRNLLAQPCGERQLATLVAAFLKMIGYTQKLQATSIAQLKFSDPPFIPYPKDDAKRIRITVGSVTVLFFNPAHKTHPPIIINYHGRGLIAPLITTIKYLIRKDARIFRAIFFAVFRELPLKINSLRHLVAVIKF